MAAERLHPDILGSKEHTEARFETIKSVFKKEGVGSPKFTAFCNIIEQGFANIRLEQAKEREQMLVTALENCSSEDPNRKKIKKQLIQTNATLGEVFAKKAAVNESIRKDEENIRGYRFTIHPTMKNLVDDYVNAYTREQKIHNNERSAKWSALSTLSDLRERIISRDDKSLKS